MYLHSDYTSIFDDTIYRAVNLHHHNVPENGTKRNRNICNNANYLFQMKTEVLQSNKSNLSFSL